MTVYRPRTIKRRTKRTRRTKDRVEQLDRQIIDVLAADHPQSVRHVFYRMTDPRLAEPVEKSERGYRHVQNRIVALRRDDRVPYGWISDTTRTGFFTDTFTDTADFLRTMQGHYRADLWRDAAHYVEVWTESRSIAGVILKDCRDLAVSLYPCGGFSSISLAYQAATHINSAHNGRTVTIFYIGDHDPAGVLIDVALQRELRAHLDPDVDLDFQRIGITAEQIVAHDLPVKPRKLGDKRAPQIKGTVEAEALPASEMRHLLRQHVEALLPENALAVARVAEESERSFISRLAEATAHHVGGQA